MNKTNLHTEIIALCDYATVAQDGKLSVQGIFDELRIQKFPGGIPQAFFVATINGTPSTSYDLTLKIEPSKGFAGEKNTFNLSTVTGPNGKNNLVIRLEGLGFKEKGDYSFVLINRGNEISSLKLRVIDVSEMKEYKLPN